MSPKLNRQVMPALPTVELTAGKLGADLMVALLVEEEAITRAVRFPGKDEWINVWTSEVYGGGSIAILPAPIDGPPFMFRRAG